MESLKAAVNNGCDAVYLGLSNFGARAFADNFTLDNIQEAVAYSHIHNVKVYVTMNTLLFQSEIAAAMEQVDKLYHCDVDALIIQDLGLLELVSKCYPDFELHASTQMAINSLNGSLFVANKGITRVVLARETPLEVIKKVCAAGIDVEIFAYGALCVSYSGQCLISSVLKNRSGNRGICAQLCRMPYKVFDFLNNDYVSLDQGYLLSLKDLNLIDHIPELIDANVTSLKIEGRMKRPEYVAYVTKIFRRAIDNYYENKNFTLSKVELDELKKLFNRGFTNGFIFNENSKDMVNSFRPNHLGIEIGYVVAKSSNKVQIKLTYPLHQFDGIRVLNKKKDVGLVCNRIYLNGLLVNKADKGEIIEMDVDQYLEKDDKVVLTSDFNSLKEIKEMVKKDSNKQPIYAKITLIKSEKIKLELQSRRNKVSLYSDFIVQEASKHEITNDRIRDCLDSIATTPYYFKDLVINKSDNIFVSVKAIKEIRRNAISQLMDLDKAMNTNRSFKKIYNHSRLNINITKQVIQEINSLDQIKNDALNFSNRRELINKNVKYLPNVIDHYDQDNGSYNFVNSLGQINNSSDFIAGMSFNITNAYALKFLYDNGANCVILSSELNQSNLDDLLNSFIDIFETKPNVAILNKGRKTLMLNKYNYLLKYADSHYALEIENEKLRLSKDNLNHLKILESKPYVSNLHNELITNKYIIRD